MRDDAEEPGRMIIALDDGRFVLSTECHYALVPTDPDRLVRGTIRAGTQLVKDYDAAREALVAALAERVADGGEP